MAESVTKNPQYQELSQKLHPQDFETLKQILNEYESDLAPTHGYFTQGDFDQICSKALQEFFKKLQKYDLANLDEEEIRASWAEVLSKFQKNYWGFKKYQEKPTMYRPPKKLNLPMKALSEIPKKISPKISYKDMFFYIWSVIQSWILIKALILVYGNDLAKDDSIQNRIIFGAIIIFSYGSLFFFVWLRRKKPK